MSRKFVRWVKSLRLVVAGHKLAKAMAECFFTHVIKDYSKIVNKKCHSDVFTFEDGKYKWFVAYFAFCCKLVFDNIKCIIISQNFSGKLSQTIMRNR